MAEARTGSDTRGASRQTVVKTAAFSIAILAIVGAAYYVQTDIYSGPGVSGIAAFLCLLVGLVFILSMG